LSEFLDGAAVPRLALVDGDDAEVMPVCPAELFHANDDGHGPVPLRSTTAKIP
jgi:hypothetical protein